MPAIVTDPPVKLPLFSRDARSGPMSGLDTGAAHQFIFEYSAPARIYVVTWSVDELYATPGQCRVFKSLDGGATWGPSLDDANGPLLPKQSEDVHQDGNILTVAYFNNTGVIKLIEFDVSTETWGTASADGPTGDNNGVPYTVKIRKYASGRFRAFYNFSSGFGEMVGSKYADLVGGVSGGAWTPEVTFDAEVIWKRKPFANLIYDPNTDLIHVITFFISIIPADTQWQIFRRTITEGGVVSATDMMGGKLIGPVNGITDPPQVPMVGKCTIWNDYIVVPTTYYITPASSGSRQVCVLMGTPIAAPVWTPVFVNTVPSPPTNQTDFESYSFASPDETTLYIFWSYTNRIGSTVEQLYWTSTTDGVTWTDPVLYYDSIANPPAFAASQQYVHAIGVIKLASGGFGATVSLQANISAPTTSDCVGYFLLEGSAPSPPSIICDNPPPALQGVPYSHFFPASGGTPPYTWSITAGHLPTGFTLNASTGEVTGTLSGFDDTVAFTVTVTDDNGLTASVTCSIEEPPLPIVICDDPPDALQGVPYSHFFPASSGTPPYTWSITVGSLPTGLALNASTGEVSGTPTVTGTFNFTVTVTDDLGQSSSVTCSITVIPTPGSNCPDEDTGGPG